MVNYTIDPELTLPDYALLRLIKQINLRDQSLPIFDEDILTLVRSGTYALLDDETIRRNLQLLVEFRESLRYQKMGFQGLIPVTRDTQKWYEGVRGEYEMMRRLIDMEARSLEEVPLDNPRNPIHSIVKLI